MEKIIRIHEISSFIMHFDNKYWNEIVLRLTIIGIRYINNFCNDIFKWKMEDLLLIIDQLKQNKALSSQINYKTNINYNKKSKNKYNRNNNNELSKYNYNYSNTLFFKKDSKEKIIDKKDSVQNFNKSKSLLNKYNVNNKDNNKKYYINSNITGVNNHNNSMIILSDRGPLYDNFINNKNRKSFGKVKENNTIKKNKDKNNIQNSNKKISKENNKYLNLNYYEEKSKKYNTNRNKILSLNDKYISNNNMDINIIVSDFPFNNKILEKEKNDINKNNYYYENNSNNGENATDFSNIINNNKNNCINNDAKNNINNSCILQNTYCLEYDNDKNNNYLINEIKKQKDNFNKNSNDFISELRKMSLGKDNKKILNNSIPSIILGSKNNMKNKYSDENAINQNINIDINNSNKENEINYNYDKKIMKDQILSKTFNRKYDIKYKQENFDLNCNYYTNNSIENIQNNKTNVNKYLRDPNYKNKKSRANSIEDLNNIIINTNRTYICSPDKENENNIKPNTDRYCCHYYYESKS